MCYVFDRTKYVVINYSLTFACVTFENKMNASVTKQYPELAYKKGLERERAGNS